MNGRHGFELLREREIPELDTRARLFRHRGTGAEILSLSNQDENKVFGITFRTPPEDSTGLPHILEHSVLCGSRKYPVKEPFVELMKGSLNTFLNAFTFPDKTCYPVASQNLQDFYNLTDVYLDAVFHPRLTPDLLKQEGWHFELDEVSAPLSYKGVVFNEMKGAQAVPERALNMAIERALLPDTPYASDSGGIPAEMPNLTWEQFSAFHQRYYHPSNSRLFFYGDDPEEARLERVAAYLDEFERMEVGSVIPLQPRLEEPTRVDSRYPAGADEAAEGRGLVAVSWVLPEVAEARRALAFHILTYLLAGTPAAPLRKALIDSGLGEGLVGGDLDVHYRQMMFSVGLKGARTESATEVEALILDTLGRLAEQGLEPEAVEAALNAVEFRLRENNSGSYPRGLLLMLNALTAWIHDGDPLAMLAFEEPLQEIRKRLAEEPRYFEALIQEHLLSNPHRTTTVVAPDPRLAEEWDAEERAQLDEIAASLDTQALEGLVEESRRLREAQERPDSPEALATIPTLKLSDLDPEQPAIPCRVEEVEGSTTLVHDLPTNGIVYLDVGLDLHRLPEELMPYAPLLGRALVEMGTARESFVELSQRIDRTTGGIRPAIFTTDRVGRDEGAGYLFLRGKATVARTEELAGILADILLEAELDNEGRFRQLVLEEKAAIETGMIPSGHRMINRRLRAHFTPGSRADEQMSGVEQLFFLRSLTEQIDEDWEQVRGRLDEVRRRLLDRDSMLLNVTVPGDDWSNVEACIRPLVAALPRGEEGKMHWAPPALPAREGLVIPAQVNYVGLGANLPALGYEVGGEALVITRYLRNDFLWDRIRVRGGAYGAFALVDHRSGTFTFLSYRDPNLLATLEAYRASAGYLRELELSEDELTKSVIGTIGDLDSYQLPDAKGYTSMSRYVAGVTTESLQKLRDEVLSIRPAAFGAFADAVAAVGAEGDVAVLASEEALERANRELEPKLEVIRLL